jgi:DNA-binding NarL/FixJ family response regulator
MDRITFLIAEKSYLIRKGIVSIINRIEHATVVKELETLDEINSALLRYSPDFLVINICLLDQYSNFRNSEMKVDLARMGIGIDPGGNVQNRKKTAFLETISIMDDREIIYNKLRSIIKEKLDEHSPLHHQTELSEREKTILKHVAKGLTNKEIADLLFLSSHTVITHRKNLTNKLGIKTISGLTVYAILNKLISIEDIE